MRKYLWLLLCAAVMGHLATSSASERAVNDVLCEPCVQADMRFLASDELRGRGSATADEHLAAMFAAALFESFGLLPGGDGGTFLQKVKMDSPLPPEVQKRLLDSEKVPRTETWNVVGVLRGTDFKLANEAILLSAHIDHLGIGLSVHGDSIYNGADDDASGTTAVLELARALSRQPRPRRSIVFALFGSEELGGFGNRYFLTHPPIALNHIIANLEFEMIGRPDPTIPRDSVWLTGYERSNLGAALVEHGAHLVRDPRPDQNFFQRSDNFALAKSGVVAHTLSSFAMHRDYHQPSDDLSHIDYTHMAKVISSLLHPLQWLANTTWKPSWNPAGKP